MGLSHSRGIHHVVGSAQWLEARSLENMVWFFQDEIRRLLNGEGTQAATGSRNVGSLCKNGILVRFHGYRGGHWALTPRAQAVFDALD